MDGMQQFIKGVVGSIPDDAGKDGPDGIMHIPCNLENPSRKRRRDDTPEPDVSADGVAGQQAALRRLQRGYALLSSMQPEAGNELLHELQDFPVLPWAYAEDAVAMAS